MLKHLSNLRKNDIYLISKQRLQTLIMSFIKKKRKKIERANL